MSLILSSSATAPRHIDSAFADATRWVIVDDSVVYNPQDRSYKEILLGGTPIEWFFTDDSVPTITCGSSSGKAPYVPPLPLKKKSIAEPDETAAAAFEFIDTETHIIRDGSWPFMSKKQLLEIPWISHSLLFPESVITFQSDYTPYKILDISPAGGIQFEYCFGRSYILKNRKKEMQLKLVNFALDADGWMLPEKITHSEYIETVCWSCEDEGFVYDYDARGKMSIYHDSNSRNYYDDRFDMDYMSDDDW